MNTLKTYASMVEKRLDELLPEVSEKGAPILNRAMRYSILAGGKRLRPAMLLGAVEMLGENVRAALDVACAVEMIHTYSLIHDDLPGMDDDILRRGRPTNHVVFGVGQAILAGDGLLSNAFETILRAGAADIARMPRYAMAAYEISAGAGAYGMVAGQSLDLQCEREGVCGDERVEMLKRIQAGKTAALFIAPLRAACRLADAPDTVLASFTEYGRAFGMLFQATDDILDVLGSGAELGKSIGKDEKSGKLTCISVFGIEKTRELVDKECACAHAALEAFGPRAAFFHELVDSMVDRTK